MTNPGTVSKWNYTEAELQTLIGKHLLVGVAHRNHDNAVVFREQFHGVVVRVNFKEGIIIKPNGTNKERTLPLDFSDFKKAQPGKYTLTGTNEVVNDPDYTITLELVDKD
jgi:hypothetical protein